MSKVIVIGIDGFDPQVAEALMIKGKLPNFTKIKQAGFYSPLTTTNPAQSPVAWSSIATGVNPGKHGIFDFIHRDPATYLPRLSIVKQNQWNFLGKRSSMFDQVMNGTPFWTVTSKNHIPTTVIKWPLTFPPHAISGRMLSGLGVPDLKNTAGRYTFYTTDNVNTTDNRGDIIKLPSGLKTINTIIIGPDKMKKPIKIEIPDTSSITLTIDGKTYVVKEKKWSDWIQITFKRTIGYPLVGMCRFFLESTKPEINLYATSLHVDPRKPSLQISSPDSYAAKLFSSIGEFHTLGLPEETNGLIDQHLSYDAILHFIDDLQKEREKILWHELKQFHEGILAFVFDAMDRIQHILGTAKDQKHPLYQKRNASYFAQVIEAYYQRMDNIVGKILKGIDSKTLFIIVSDHGFSTFRSVIHVNTWLVDQGLMTLKGSSMAEPLFENVDWEKTYAYALGFSSIYVNLRGRERNGIINPGEASNTLLHKIRRKLLTVENPKTKENVIHNAYLRSEIYKGPYVSDAPDIILGVKPGYRFSWQTAIGGGANNIIEDNLKPWSADHIVDPSFVPGVVFMNRKAEKAQPCLYDITPTLLEFFDISPSPQMDGKTIL